MPLCNLLLELCGGLFFIAVHVEADTDLCWQPNFLHHIFNVSGTWKDIWSFHSIGYHHSESSSYQTRKHADLSRCLYYSRAQTLILESEMFSHFVYGGLPKAHHRFSWECCLRTILAAFRAACHKDRAACDAKGGFREPRFAFDRPLTLSSAAMRTSPQPRLEGHVERCKFRQDHRESCKA